MIARLNALSKGTSLLEVLALVTILGILVVCLVPYFGEASKREQHDLDRQNRLVINEAIEQWYLTQGSWPSESLAELATDKEHFPHGLPVNPVTGKAYTLHLESKTVQ